MHYKWLDRGVYANADDDSDSIFKYFERLDYFIDVNSAHILLYVFSVPVKKFKLNTVPAKQYLINLSSFVICYFNFNTEHWSKLLRPVTCYMYNARATMNMERRWTP